LNDRIEDGFDEGAAHPRAFFVVCALDGAPVGAKTMATKTARRRVPQPGIGVNDMNGRYDTYKTWGLSGTRGDVDALMNALMTDDDLATTRLVDFALGLVDGREGVARLRHYLFHGAPRQRNYAALYFKRRGHVALLSEAVDRGAIDGQQAFSR